MAAVDAKPARAGIPALCLAALLALGCLASSAMAQVAPQPPDAAPAGPGSLPASIPVLRDAPDADAGPAGSAWWIGVGATLLLLAVAVVVQRKRTRPIDTSRPWWAPLRTLLDTSASPDIQRVSSLRLSPGQNLHVVVWEGRRLLLGCTDQAIRLLAESADDTAAKSADPGLPHCKGAP